MFADQPDAIPDPIPHPIRVGLKGFGDSAIDMELIGALRVASFDKFVAARHRLVGDIVACAERMGVDFAFQTRTAHIAPAGAESSAAAQ